MWVNDHRILIFGWTTPLMNIKKILMCITNSLHLIRYMSECWHTEGKQESNVPRTLKILPFHKCQNTVHTHTHAHESYCHTQINYPTLCPPTLIEKHLSHLILHVSVRAFCWSMCGAPETCIAVTKYLFVVLIAVYRCIKPAQQC